MSSMRRWGASVKGCNCSSIPSNLLQGTQDMIQTKGDDVPPQFIPTPLLSHITRTGIEIVFQKNDAREETFNLVPDGGGSL